VTQGFLERHASVAEVSVYPASLRSGPDPFAPSAMPENWISTVDPFTFTRST
jgi:hypothetical protein